MNSQQKKYRSTLLLKVLLTILILSFSFTEQLKAQEDDNPLSDKIHEMIDKMKEIRLKLVSIALKGQGVPNWDRFENAVDRLSETIGDVETRIDNLVDRISNLQLPFPNNLNFPRRRILILGRYVTFPSVNIPVPGSNRQFPKVSEFFADFLEPGNKALDKILELATTIDDSMSTIPLSYPVENPSSDTTDWVYANYTWPNTQGTFWTRPGWVLTMKVINQTLQGVGEVLKDCFDQEIIIGAGGNIALAKGITDGILAALNVFMEIAGELDGDATEVEVTASYYRLKYIKEQLGLQHSEQTIFAERELDYDIEQNLAGQGSYQQPMAIFQLPSYYGGHLERAQQIVEDVIERMLQAGENIYQAVEYHARGDEEFINGNYKLAYYYYGKAYSEATFVEEPSN